MPRSPITVSYPSGSAVDELVRLRGAGGSLHVRGAGADHAERDVLAHGRREEERILGHDADGAAQRLEPEVANVDAVDQHATSLWVVEARDERGQRRLPGAGAPDQRHDATRSDVEVEPVHDRLAAVVRERDVIEGDPSAACRQRTRVRAVADVLPARRAPRRSARLPPSARWICPIHIPSIRSGNTSISR